jgi:hypothetical protein
MTKSISTQYFLREGRSVICSSDSKKDIFNEYQYHCERNPSKNYSVVRQETFLEEIAKSGDFRQSLFDF